MNSGLLEAARSVPMMPMIRRPIGGDSELPDPANKGLTARLIHAYHLRNLGIRYEVAKAPGMSLADDRQLCKLSPLYGLERYGVIRPEEQVGLGGVMSEAPLIPWDSQIGAIWWMLGAIDAGGLYAIVKSREIGLTHIAAWLALTLAEQRGLGFVIGSKRMREVDSAPGDESMRTFFGKVRYFRRHLPEHLRGRVLDRQFRMIFEGGGSIVGEATTADFGRGNRGAVAFIDEYLAIDPKKARAMVTAATGACRTVILIFNYDALKPVHPGREFAESLPPNRVLRLDWTASPFRRRGPQGDEWFWTRVLPVGNLTLPAARADYGADPNASLAGQLVFDGLDLSDDSKLWFDGEEIAKLRRASTIFGGMDFGRSAAFNALPLGVSHEGTLYIDWEIATSNPIADVCAEFATGVGLMGYAGICTIAGDPTAKARESDGRSQYLRAREGGLPVRLLPSTNSNSHSGRERAIKTFLTLAAAGRIRIRRGLRHVPAVLRHWRREELPENYIAGLAIMGDPRFLARTDKGPFSHMGEAILYLAEHWAIQEGLWL